MTEPSPPLANERHTGACFAAVMAGLLSLFSRLRSCPFSVDVAAIPSTTMRSLAPRFKSRSDARTSYLGARRNLASKSRCGGQEPGQWFGGRNTALFSCSSTYPILLNPVRIRQAGFLRSFRKVQRLNREEASSYWGLIRLNLLSAVSVDMKVRFVASQFEITVTLYESMADSYAVHVGDQFAHDWATTAGQLTVTMTFLTSASAAYAAGDRVCGIAASSML